MMTGMEPGMRKRTEFGPEDEEEDGGDDAARRRTRRMRL